MRALPGDEPVLVNSAGCGAAMKDYGHLLGTAEAAAFAARVRDVHEWLADRVDELPAEPGGASSGDRPGPVPPAPRPAGRRVGAPCARPLRRHRRARRRWSVLRGGRRLLGVAARAGGQDPRPQDGGHRAGSTAQRGDDRRLGESRVLDAPRGGRCRRPPPDGPRGRGDRTRQNDGLSRSWPHDCAPSPTSSTMPPSTCSIEPSPTGQRHGLWRTRR